MGCLFFNLWLWLSFNYMFLHIKHHSSSGNEQNPKNLFFRALKKNPFLEKLFLSKTQKILRFEKKSLMTNIFYIKFRIIWYMCATCSISRILNIVNIWILNTIGTKKCNLIDVRPYFQDMTLIYFPKYSYIPQKSYVKCHPRSKIKAPPYW